MPRYNAPIKNTSEDHKDDKDGIVMGFKDSAWGNGYVSIVRRELPDGTPYPTQEEIAGELGVADSYSVISKYCSEDELN